MADTNLGNLAYKLSLDKKDFDRDVKMLRASLDALYKHRTVYLSGINKNSLNNIQQAINKAEFKIKKLIIDPDTTREYLQRQIDAISKDLTAKITLEVNPKASKSGSASLDDIANSSKKAQTEEGKRKQKTDDANKSLEEGKDKANALSGSLSRAAIQSNSLADAFKNLKPIIGDVFSLYGLKRFLDGLIDVGGEIQKQRMALGHIIGNDSNANILFNEMKDLAVKSPFGLLDLMQNARQLSAFGVEYNKLYDTMKRLSDVAAGLGIQFGRLSLVYGETMERGYLDGKLVRQFSYMGLPVLQKIAEYYTKIHQEDTGQIFNAKDVREMVSKRQVSFEDVDAVIKTMTNAEGQFYNMQEVMAESVAGKWKNLQDAIDIMFSDIVEGNSALIKAPAEIMTKLVKNYETFSVVLGLVAARMVGAKAASMMYTSIMGKEVSALHAKMSAEKAANVQTQLRVQAVQGETIAEMKKLVATKALTAADIEQAFAEKKITEEEQILLATRLRANSVNARYMYSLGIITSKQVAMVRSGNAVTAFMGRMSIATSLLGKQLKMLSAEFMATATAMLANPMTWIFAAIAGVTELVHLWNQANEDNENVKKGMKDVVDSTWKDVKNIEDTIQLRWENGKIISNASEIQTAIDDLVKFIKDDVPGAQAILDDAFAVDGNTHLFRKSVEDRYNILYDYYTKVKKLLEEDVIIQVDDAVSEAFKVSFWNKIGSDNLMQDVKDFETEYKDLKSNLLDVFANLSLEDNQWLLEVKNALNVKSNAELVEKLLNPDYMSALENLPKNRSLGVFNRLNLGFDVKAYKRAYDEYISEFESTMDDLQNRLKSVFGSGFSFSNMTEEQRIAVQFEISSFLQKSEASEWVREHMRETFMTRWNIDVNVGGDAKKADSIWQMLYGDKIAVGNDDNINQVIETARKQKKEAEEALKTLEKDSKYASLKKLGKSDLGMFKIIDLDETKIREKELKEYGRRVNEVTKSLNDAQYVLDREGIKDEKNDGNSKKDTVLEEWKEKFDKLKKTYAEFKKWKAVVGADAAKDKVNALGMMNKDALAYFGLSQDDLNDPEKYDSAIKRFFENIQDKLTTESRKKWSENLPVEMSGIELDIANEDIRKATAKIQQKFTEAMKQYDVWKTWFGLTGNNQMATDIALNIKPMWSEKAKWMRDAFEKDATSKGISIDFKYDMTDEEAKQFFVGNKSALLDTYKKVRDAFRDGGYDAANEIANALKDSMSEDQKYDVINNKYDRLIAQDMASTGGMNVSALEGKRRMETMQLITPYQRLMESVTSLTEEAAKEWADFYKKDFLNALKRGSITMEQYVQGIKKIDDQLKKNITKLKSYSQAVLLGKTSEWYQQNYDNALFKQKKTANRVRETQDKVKLEKSKLGNDINADNSAYVQAVQDNITATQDLTEATKELKDAEDAKNGNESKMFSDSEVNGFILGTQKVIKSFDQLSKIATNLGANMDGFDNVVGLVNSTASGAQSGSNLATALGGSGYIGAIIGAVVGAASYMSELNRKQVSQHEKEFEEDIQVVERFMKRLSDTIEESLTGIDSFVMDSATKARLEKYAKDYTYNYLEDNNAWNDSTNAKYKKEAMQQSKKALETGSYYDTQLALLYQQREQINNALESEQDAKDPDDSAIDDYRNQLEDLESDIRDFAKDMAKELYSIDFKGWADQLSETLVNAWRNGENAVQAYKNAVSDMLSSTLSSVISQKIIGTQLNDLAEEFYKSFEDNSGEITTDGEKILAKMYSLASEATTATYKALDASEKYANEQGGTYKSWESSVGNSIQSVSEETADILASYINVMRSDLSAQRVSVESINAMLANADYGIQKQYLQAEQQTRHLEAIENHTSSIRVATQELLYAFNQVCDGTQKIHIS